MSKNFKTTVFRDMTQWSPVDWYRCSERNCYLLHQGFFSGEMQAAVFSKQIMWFPFTSLSFQRIHVMFYKEMSPHFCTCARFSLRCASSPTVGNSFYVLLEPHKSAETHTTTVGQFPLLVSATIILLLTTIILKLWIVLMPGKFFFYLTLFQHGSNAL
jgi:hypothetical protein